MSKILKNKFFAIACLGLVWGIAGMHYWDRTQTEGTIDFASIHTDKFEHLPGVAQTHSKHLAVMTVRLDAPASIPLDSQDPVEISGVVVLNQGPPQDVDVNWELADDIQILSGENSFQIQQMLPGKAYEVSIVVAGFNKTDKKVITVSASTVRNGVRIGNSSLVSSRPEDSMEFIAPAMAEAAAELDTAPVAGKIIK